MVTPDVISLSILTILLFSHVRKPILDTPSHIDPRKIAGLPFSPMSIVQDGGDTVINGTADILPTPTPTYIIPVERGVSPYGRAIIASPQYHPSLKAYQYGCSVAFTRHDQKQRQDEIQLKRCVNKVAKSKPVQAECYVP